MNFPFVASVAYHTAPMNIISCVGEFPGGCGAWSMQYDFLRPHSKSGVDVASSSGPPFTK